MGGSFSLRSIPALQILISRGRTLSDLRLRMRDPRQCGPVVRTLALRSGDPGFMTRSEHSLNFFSGSPWFNFPAVLVNSQLVSLRPVGILKCCCYVLSFR